MSWAFNFTIHVETTTEFRSVMCAQVFNRVEMITFTENQHINVIELKALIGTVGERIDG
jgi:hypothetical protein